MNTFLRIAAAIGAVGLARIGIEAAMLLSSTSYFHAVVTGWAFSCLVGYQAYLAVRGFKT